MSRAVFNYSEMEKAASAAKKAADKLTDYRDELDKKVAKKLDSYSGRRTGHISSAAMQIRNKKRALEDKADDFRDYSNSLTSLVSACKTADTAVKRHISSLAQQFTSQHGIKISDSEYSMMLRSVSRGNANLPARWLNDKDDQFSDWLAGKGRDFMHWYKYGGGKYAIWENIKAALKAVAAVAAIVATIAAFMAAPLTLGSTLVLVAGLFTGIMTLFDAGTDAVYNCKAADAAARGDPVLAKRLDGVDDYTDALRRESDSRFVHDYCNFLDITETAATVVTLLSSIKKLATKGYKWVTNGDFSVKDFKWLNKENGFSFKAAKDGASLKFKLLKADLSDFGRTIKAGDFKTAGQTLREFSKTWFEYFKHPFTEAKDGISGIKSLSNLNGADYWKGVKDAADGIKFFVDIPKSLFEEGGWKDYFGGLALSGFGVGGEDSISLDDIKSKLLDKPISIGKNIGKEISYQVDKGNSKNAAEIWRSINIHSVPRVTVGDIAYGTP